MGQAQEGNMLDESRDDDDKSRGGMSKSEKVLQCRQGDQVFNSWDTLMDHTRLQHSNPCYEYFKIPGTDSYFSDHITHKFQCDECGLKFAEESSSENHIVEGHEVTCEDCNTIFGNDSHFEYHKYKHHEPSLKPPAIAADDKTSLS